MMVAWPPRSDMLQPVSASKRDTVAPRSPTSARLMLGGTGTCTEAAWLRVLARGAAKIALTSFSWRPTPANPAATAASSADVATGA